jgi:hypothetical protein
MIADSSAVSESPSLRIRPIEGVARTWPFEHGVSTTPAARLIGRRCRIPARAAGAVDDQAGAGAIA